MSIEITMERLSAERHSELTHVLAGCALGTGACAAYMALPVLLGIIADTAKLSDQQVGWLGSVELTGMMVGALVLTLLHRAERIKPLAALALLAVLVGVVGLRGAHTFTEIATFRAIGGLGAGLGNSLAVVSIGCTLNVARNQGWLNAAIIVCGGIELTLFGTTSATYGLDGAVWPLLAISACVLVAVPFLATTASSGVTDKATDANAPSVNRAALGPVALCCWLLCVTMAQMAPAASYAYAERIALEMGVIAATSGPVLTCGAFLSALACLVAWRVSARIGSVLCAALCMAGLIVVMVSWAAPGHGAASYAVRTVLTQAFWAVLTVYQITAMSELSDNPRWLSLVPTAQNLGLAVGPALGAGLIGESGSLAHSMASCATALLLPVTLVLVLHWKARRNR
jgi:predicted MFS family arabinose efflux permease